MADDAWKEHDPFGAEHNDLPYFLGGNNKTWEQLVESAKEQWKAQDEEVEEFKSPFEKYLT